MVQLIVMIVIYSLLVSLNKFTVSVCFRFFAAFVSFRFFLMAFPEAGMCPKNVFLGEHRVTLLAEKETRVTVLQLGARVL